MTPARIADRLLGLADPAMSGVRALADLVYPRACAGCGAGATHDALHFCWDCLARSPFIAEGYCQLCGDVFDGELPEAFTCAWCARQAPHFERARSALRYCGPVRRGMHRYKYGHEIGLAHDLVTFLHAGVKAHYAGVRFDGVVYVPLHAARERERTYNQARILARGLARRMRTPYFARGLRRVRDTGTQTRLTAGARRRNVKGAFAVPAPEWVEGRRLLLVDDVMTTGATVNECARVLKQAGAVGVWVLTVARG